MTGPPPDITAVSVVRHGVLRLTFADGVTGEVDVLARMWGPVFEQARTHEGFAKVGVDEETGTIVWPDDADLRHALRARAHRHLARPERRRITRRESTA